jgi:hypothetical protein
MSYQPTMSCDVCGKHKEVSNHWWVVFQVSGLELWPWREDLAQHSEAKHLCGEGCAAKLMSKWMETTSKAAGGNNVGNNQDL